MIGTAEAAPVPVDLLPKVSGIVFCSGPDFPAERILEYKSKYSLRRFLYKFDYVRFLNSHMG